MFILLLSCSSCTISASQTPDLMPDSKFSETTSENRENDVKACLKLADQNVADKSNSARISRRTVLGLIAGTITGAISGTIGDDGETAESVAAGAAVGTVVGFLQAMVDISERTPQYERFTENCLHQKGYQITGWSEKD